MQISKIDLYRFREIFNVPDFIEPWLDQFFTIQDINLVLLLADQPLRIGEIAEQWTGAEYDRDLDLLQDFLDRSCKRGVVSRGEEDRYQPTKAA